MTEVSVNKDSSYTIKYLPGKDARQYFIELAALRLNTFKDFPYLFQGSLEYEREYLEIYFRSEYSAVILVLDSNEKVIGFSTSVPLYEMAPIPEIQKPFIEKNLDLKEYLYLGEGIIQPSYRGRGILKSYFDHHEAIAKKKCMNATFMTIKRSMDHPSCPPGYRSLNPLWHRFGYNLLNDMKINVTWTQSDSQIEEINELEVWSKEFNL